MEVRCWEGDRRIGSVCVSVRGLAGADTEELDWLAVAANAGFHAGPDPWRPVLAALLLEADLVGYRTEEVGSLPSLDFPEGAVT